MHHLGRHAVACFLTRGGCYVDWERGADVFEEWLIDHETACNAGNWQWLSCTAFFSQFYRVYSPVAFPQRTDKEGLFVRRYVPELAKFDRKYIYEPWKAPIADQKKWGCLVKGDGGVKEEGGYMVYPKPIFDFAERRDVCLSAMKTAYKVGLHGDDERVKNGSWTQLFDDNAEWPTSGDVAVGTVISGANIGYIDAEDDEVNSLVDEVREEPPHIKRATAQKRPGGQMTLEGMVKRTRRR